MKKNLVGIGVTAFVAWIAMNINLALTGEKSLWVNWENAVALTNNEVLKMVYTYDASGNIISRTLVQPSMAPPPPIGTDPTTVDFADAGNMEETEDTGSSSLKSTVSRPGSTNFAVPETPGLDDMKITVYPNPTQGILYVDIAGIEIPQDAQIEIFTANGASVGKWTGVSSTHTVDITEKPAGIYIVRLTLDKEHVNSWKIVKK